MFETTGRVAASALTADAAGIAHALWLPNFNAPAASRSPTSLENERDGPLEIRSAFSNF